MHTRTGKPYPKLWLPRGASGATPFLVDSFTDTDGINLTARTPETGGAWSKNSLAVDDLLIEADAPGTIYGSGAANFAIYGNAATPPSPDYTITATVPVKTLLSGTFVAILGRGSMVADTAYKLVLTLTALLLQATVAGSTTTLQSYTLAGADVLAPSDLRTIALTMTGTAITGSMDGNIRCSGTDNQIATAGKVLVRCRNSTSTTGLHISSVQAA